jgi:hypothetical protein
VIARWYLRRIISRWRRGEAMGTGMHRRERIHLASTYLRGLSPRIFSNGARQRWNLQRRRCFATRGSRKFARLESVEFLKLSTPSAAWNGSKRISIHANYAPHSRTAARWSNGGETIMAVRRNMNRPIAADSESRPDTRVNCKMQAVCSSDRFPLRSARSKRSKSRLDDLWSLLPNRLLI